VAALPNSKITKRADAKTAPNPKATREASPPSTTTQKPGERSSSDNNNEKRTISGTPPDNGTPANPPPKWHYALAAGLGVVVLVAMIGCMYAAQRNGGGCVGGCDGGCEGCGDCGGCVF